MEWALKGLSHKTTNTRKNYGMFTVVQPIRWDVKIVKVNHQTTIKWFHHNSIRNNKLDFSFKTNLQFYCHFSKIIGFFFYFSLCTNEEET